jgi:hypothetical protein
MSKPVAKAKRPDYGIDAPGAVRNLAIGGAAALVLAAAAFPLGWAPLARMATGAAIGCLFSAGWMVWGSKVEKVRGRDRLVRHTGRYAQVLRQSVLEDVRRSPESVPALLIAAITLGFAYPATVTARKPAAA